MDARLAVISRERESPVPMPTCPEYLVATSQKLVRRVAWQVYSRTSTSIPVEDLIQIGHIALIEASRAFVDRGTAVFSSYATLRIRGAMIDALRKSATISRLSLRRRREFAEVRKNLNSSLGRAPTEGEMADHFDMPIGAYQGAIDAMNGVEYSSIDEVYSDQSSWFADGSDDAFTVLSTARRAETVAAAIAQLTEREQVILQLYYADDCTLEEIGAIFSVRSARICQIKKAALLHLRVQLRAWAEE